MANRIKCKFDKSVCGTYLGTIVESGLKKVDSQLHTVVLCQFIKLRLKDILVF